LQIFISYIFIAKVGGGGGERWSDGERKRRRRKGERM
jgi:hypothetical protein